MEDPETMAETVVVDEERLKKLSHLYSAKRKSLNEPIEPIKVNVPVQPLKSMSVEKIMAMKGKKRNDSNGKKVRSLPRRIDFNALKEDQKMDEDVSVGAVKQEISQPAPPLPEVSIAPTTRVRSETIGTTAEAMPLSKKGSKGSVKRNTMPTIHIGEDDETMEATKPLDLATTNNGSPARKKLPLTSSKEIHEMGHLKDRGDYKTAADRGQATIPVIFRDLSLTGVTSDNNKPPIPAITSPISSPKIERSTAKERSSKTSDKAEKEKDKSKKTMATSKSTGNVAVRPMIKSKTPTSSEKISGSGPPRKLSAGSEDAKKRELQRKTPTLPSRKISSAASTSILLKNKHNLSIHEQKEVLEYSEVFYTGDTNAKIMVASKTAPNKGYDDEKGDYRIIPKDHVGYRYEIIGLLGSGAFGQVCKVLDHKTGKHLALKIIRNRKRYHDQALIEHKILAYVKQKDPHGQSNIITMVDFFYFRNHICFTFELLSINLYDFIKANHFRGSTEKLIRKFSVKMLQSMKFLAKHHIIHCDLKPENVLLNDLSKSDVTLIDFGSSCFEHEKIFTYIQSRFYRAPEIILGIPYGISIDMWSFGCILAELLTGYPLFPGENELDQLACIMEILGVPPEDLLKDATRKKYFFASNGRPRIIENSNGIKRFPGTKTIQDFLPTADPLLISFIADCIKWYPKERLTPANALQHPWMLLDGPTENFTSDLND